MTTTASLHGVGTWLLAHRARVNRWLYAAGALALLVALAVAVLAPSVAATVATPSGLAWAGMALVVVAFPWTLWMNVRVDAETLARRADAVRTQFRPPVL